MHPLGGGARARAGARGRVRSARDAREPPSRPRVAPRPVGARARLRGLLTELQPLALHTFLWAHLLQNVVLAEWAPGCSCSPCRRCSRRAAAASRSSARSSRCRSGSSTYFAWHLPWIYDYALRHPHSLLHARARDVSRRGHRVWWPVIHGRYPAGAKAALPLRRLRARVAARAAARAHPAAGLLVLRARAADVGAGAARRPADRGRDDGGRAGGRLLRRLRALPAPLPPRGATRPRRLRRAAG